MPYILGKPIRESDTPLWGEGAPYVRKKVFRADDPQGPPVNYDAHTLLPHSLTHFETGAHVEKGGATVDQFFSSAKTSALYGPVTLIRVSGPEKEHHEISLKELQGALVRISGERTPPEKILVARNGESPVTLSADAAKWLISNPRFNLYGTSWKSTDFQPDSRERPIHKILFTQAAVLENLALAEVPEGVYFMVAVPLPLVSASESPCCPILFTKQELQSVF